ncbi:Sec20-domain-containing protein [Gautieria morchelliformis]|nr:Sec20-domain-containing protein [Gautieria morchelliformis]
MPPLPCTIQKETANLVESLTRRQKDLEEFQIPRLREFKGSLAAQQRYAAELQEDLELFGKNVQVSMSAENTLDSLVEDQERERERREVAHRAQQFTKSFDQMRKNTRVALLTSKRAIDSMAISNRHELLKSTMMSEKSSDEKTGDALINASNDVTEALRRTIGLMQGELERSVLSSQMLEQSSANLRSTTAAHDTLSTLLSTSKHLITALEKSDWLDRLLIFAAVSFFFLVVLFILKQRVIDKGIRIAFWWTRFIPEFSRDVEMLKAGLTETGTVVTVATMTALSPASTVFVPTIDDAAFTTLPSGSTPTPDIYGVDHVVQEILTQTATQSPFTLTSETSTILLGEPNLHKEL